MTVQCYNVEINSSLDGMYEQLDDYGFDYECEYIPTKDGPDYIEISIQCYPHEVKDLEDIMKWYV